MCLDVRHRAAPRPSRCFHDLSRSVAMATEEQDNDLSTLMSGNVCLGVAIATTCYNSCGVKIKTVVMGQDSELVCRAALVLWRARAVCCVQRDSGPVGAHVLHGAGGLRGAVPGAAERARAPRAPPWACRCARCWSRGPRWQKPRARLHMLTHRKLSTTISNSRQTLPGTCTCYCNNSILYILVAFEESYTERQLCMLCHDVQFWPKQRMLWIFLISFSPIEHMFHY